MTIIYSVLTALLLVFSISASFIDFDSTATLFFDSATLTTQHWDTFLVLNSTQATTTQPLNYSLYLLTTGNFINVNSTLAAAFQRSYTNSTSQYHLYMYNVDGNYDIQQYEAVVRLASNDVYVLMEFSSYTISGNLTSSDPEAASNYLVAPQASSLNQVVTKLTLGYTYMSSSQIKSNVNINSMDKSLKNAFNLAGSTLIYAAQQTVSSQINYRIFYSMRSGSTFQIKVGSAVYNSDYKTLFILSLLQILLPTHLIPQ